MASLLILLLCPRELTRTAMQYEHYTLANGLRVYLHQDQNVSTVALNIVYDVGSRDEDEEHTGFAHLFEHLMFGGSLNVPSYDEPLQAAGGENNAFTSPDITNYYLTLPADNLETGLWLESDRMLSLNFDPQVLEVQRKVVIEEFNQRYLNQPYGDAWLKLRPLVYQVHPYRWATIGKEVSHIADATMDQVRDFFHKHYVPANAVLVLAGKFEPENARHLIEKWFGPIPAQPKPVRNLPQEPTQTSPRELTVSAAVPANRLYLAWHAPARFHEDFYASCLLAQWMGYGPSSVLHDKLVKEQELFSNISMSVTASTDTGLYFMQGTVKEGVDVATAEAAIWQVLEAQQMAGISAETLTKTKNQYLTANVFENAELLNRAMNLAYYAINDRADDVDKEADLVSAVTEEQVNRLIRTELITSKVNLMRYLSQQAN